MSESMHAAVGMAVGFVLSVVIIGLIANGRRRVGDDRPTAERVIANPVVVLIVFGVPIVSALLIGVLS